MKLSLKSIGKILKKAPQWIFIQLLQFRANQVLKKTKDIIGITGSVGKTSTRFLMSHVLSPHFRVQTSSQNFNTPIGLLLSILSIEKSGSTPFEWIRIFFHVYFHDLPQPEILLLEFGVDQKGDMQKLLKICQPKTVVITPIALAHTAKGQFRSVHDIQEEKLQICEKAERIIANLFDSETAAIIQGRWEGKTMPFGTAKDLPPPITGLPTLEISDIHQTEKGICFLGNGHQYCLPVFGNFQIQIAAPSLLLDFLFHIPTKEIQKSFDTFSPPKGRGLMMKGKNETTLWDFSYNSSPKASSAVLNSFGEMRGKGQKIAILGTMNELGDFAEREHEKLGKEAEKVSDSICFVGRYKESFSKGVGNKKPLHTFENADECGKFLLQEIKEGDILLFKGSQNGVFLEETIKMLLQNSEDEKRLCRQSEEWIRKKEK